MAKRYDTVVIAAFIAAACIPAAARLASFRDRLVYGALPSTTRPAPSLGSIRDESFQRDFTTWFERTLALKGYAIFIDNTVLYHALRDTKPTSTVRIGDDDVLFLGDDLAYYNATPAELGIDRFDRFDRFARKVAALQQRLAQQHRALIPLIVPSKTSVYPDKVSPRWTRDPGAPRVSDELVYRELRRALEAHHVRYVDARGLFATSSEPREALWPTTGRHWTQYGACLAFAEVARAFTELTARPLDIECRIKRIRGRSDDGDYDLYRLLNTWFVRRPHDAIETEETAPPPSPRPSVMFAGTSFGWNLLTVAERSHQVDAFMDYYDSTLITGPNNTSSDLRATPDMWRDAMRGKDLYVLELFEPYVGAPDAHLEQFPEELSGALD